MSTIIRNNKLFCTCCGGEFALSFPISVDDYANKAKLFTSLHKDCKQTWVEPKEDQTKSVMERAMWWLANGDKGMSSTTMWNCFMEISNFQISHPHDPDDFSRCYKLLETIPEWKKELHKLKSLSRVWNNLVENWDKLTEMYEENCRTDWTNYKQIGMYKFMQTLTNSSNK